MVGVLVVGFIASLLIRPVDRRFHEDVEPQRERRAAGEPAMAGARGERG
jgi:hypothetical protein